ncbi:MAG: transposase [Bacteroidales bacterium]|nr:transposase [Bacteroidales bacterium]
MNSTEIFQLALQLSKPWYVTAVRFESVSESKMDLHIDIGFDRSFKFSPVSKRQKMEREELIELLPNVGNAYRLKMLFQDFWGFDNKQDAAAFLAFWCDLVDEDGIVPFKNFANTIKGHWSGIVNYIESQIANGILEGVNNKIQLAKRRARGYRNINNFINMIYFLAGKLKFNFPHDFT